MLSSIWDYKLDHDYPIGYLAGDAFWHQVYTQSVYEEGNAAAAPLFMTYNTEDAVFFQPPVLYHFSALLMGITGLHSWDANLLSVSIFIILTALCFFIMLYNVNKFLALLSTPLFVFMLTFPFSKVYLWGWHIAITGLLLMSASFYIIYNWDKFKYPYVVYGLVLSFSVMSYFDSFLYSIGFLFLFILYNLVTGGIRLKLIKEYLISGLVFLITSGYYLWIFKNTWLYDIDPGSKFLTFKPEFPSELLQVFDFGVFSYLIVIGVLVSLLIVKRDKAYFLIPLYLFVISFSNYIGFYRIARFNFLLPIFLAPFFGLVVYSVVSRINFLKNKYYIVTIILFVIVMFGIYTPFSTGQSLTNQYSWEAFTWLKVNVPSNKEVVFIHDEAGTYQTAILWNSGHPSINVLGIDSFDDVRGIIKCDIVGNVTVKKGLFSFDHIFHQDKKYDRCLDAGFNFSLCEFEYVYIGKSRSDELNKHLQGIINQLINDGRYEIAYSNPGTIIFRNAGGVC